MGWSNEIPNPFIVGGGGVSGSILVLDALGRTLITIDSAGMTVFDPATAGVLALLGPAGLVVSNVADIADLLLRGLSLAPAFPTYTQYLQVDLPGSRQFQILYNSATNTTEIYSLGVAAINFSEGPTQETVPVVLTNGQVPIGNWQPWRQILTPNVGDFSNAAFADWLTGFSSIPVPLWAQAGTATAEIKCDVQPDIITGAGTYNLRLVVDPTVVAATNGPTSMLRGAAATQFGASAVYSYPIPTGATALAVKVQAQLVAGASALRGSAAVNMIATLDAVTHI